MSPPQNARFLPVALVAGALLAAGCTLPEAPVVTTHAPTGPGTPDAPPGGDAGTRPPPAADDPPLTFLRSQNGILQVKLDLVNASVTVNGTAYPTAVYNGRLMNPVWVLQPGDVLQVFLQDHRVFANGSADVGAHAGHGAGEEGAGPEYTNLHFHGLNVPPTPPGDNVFIAVNPNGSAFKPWDYRYALVIPEDHPQGLFWWHAHPHGLSNDQVRGGMSGAMVIGDVLGTHYPQFADAEERVFLLRDFSNQPLVPQKGPTQNATPTINGETWAEVDIAPGELQFWRFANIGGNLDFQVALVSNATGKRVPFHVVAVDGNVLDQPRTNDTLFLYPGARLEVLVVGPEAGDYTLRSGEVEARKAKQPVVDLASVVSGGTPGNASASEVENATNARPDARFLALRQWVEDGNATVPRTMVFSGNPPHNGTINGLQYDVARNDTVVNFGDVETWTIVNGNTAGPHVFHIHQLDFLVTHVNGQPVDMRGLQDTAFVPGGGNVTLVIPFTEAQTLGRFVYHCHYLPHEDNGMMANIVVQAPPAGTVVV